MEQSGVKWDIQHMYTGVSYLLGIEGSYFALFEAAGSCRLLESLTPQLGMQCCLCSEVIIRWTILQLLKCPV